MNARFKPLLILARLLCVCLLALVAYACILQPTAGITAPRRRASPGTPASGREDVRICVTQQEEGYLYAIWGKCRHRRDLYDIFGAAECAGPQLSPSHGCKTPLSANGTVFKIYQTGEGDGSPKRASSSSLPAITAAAPWTAVS